MTENTNTTYKNRFTAFLLGNRIIITRGTKTVANMPILVGIIAALCTIRLTVLAVIIALLLGYRFSIDKFDFQAFEATIRDTAKRAKVTVHDAASKIKSTVANASTQVKDAVKNVKQEIHAGIESWDGAKDHH